MRTMKKRNITRIIAALLILMLSVGMLSGCRKKTPAPTENPTSENEQEEEANNSESEQNSESSREEETSGEAVAQPEEAQLIDEDGIYNSKEDVALYLYTYGHLPSNYITKNEAKGLGWSGGSVERYGEKLAIGGDKYGNYEGLLPEGHKYHECDVDTWGKKKRGAKRIVWSESGNIYYTEDHYESFELLYGDENA